jgi:hypothetical protein
MIERTQHKAVYSVPTGDESGFSRVEVIAPFGMTVAALRESVEAYLASHPGAMLLSRTWRDE